MNNKNFTASFFRERLPDWKKKRDPLMVHFVYRPVSFFTASFCANHGIGANSVSNFSTIIAVIACLLIAIPNFYTGIIGALLMNFWITLDCTDGNLAREVKKEAYGDFLDGMSSYILVGLFFVSVGFRVFQIGELLPTYREYFFLLGALTSILQNLMSLLYQKFLNVSYGYGKNEKLAYDGSNSSKLMKVKTAIDMNLSVGGFLPIVILICCIFNVCEFIVVFWFLYYFAEFCATIVYLLHKVKMNQKDISIKQ